MKQDNIFRKKVLERELSLREGGYPQRILSWAGEVLTEKYTSNSICTILNSSLSNLTPHNPTLYIHFYNPYLTFYIYLT